MKSYFLGYDVGSSSVKTALTDEHGHIAGHAQYPSKEMAILSPAPGFAEQAPDTWWKACCKSTALLLKKTGIHPDQIKSIGISYQMHGLVLTDKKGKVLRPAIIWCDSRAVATGDKITAEIKRYCLDHCLNLPGNFTASKLRWVMEHEPEIAEAIDKIMLPGDYIAFCMTGEKSTTISGLSEGILWDFKKHSPAHALMSYYGIPESMIPEIVPTSAIQGKLTVKAAAALGLTAGIPIAYRSGDQPNNAMSMNVLHPGQVAATGGTSGVVYAVSDKYQSDPSQKVNQFAHINHQKDTPRIGTLLCINGAGSMYSWIRSITSGMEYKRMEQLAGSVRPGSEGLKILPFGNGAERILSNQNPGAAILGLDFNRHQKGHLYRAALEGIAFAFVLGMEHLMSLGIPVDTMRVGNDNLFQSSIFSNTIAALIKCRIEMVESTGAIGAAIGGQFGAGYISNPEICLSGLKTLRTYDHSSIPYEIRMVYEDWKNCL